MVKTNGKKLFSYLGRFALLHLFINTVFAFLFLNIQRSLPEGGRIALDIFSPYQPFSFSTVITQFIRILACGLVLYPFYDTITNGRKGMLILFGAMWGLTLFTSADPAPGTIQGMVYTQTTFFEHAITIFTVAIQMLVFAWLFIIWEAGSGYGLSGREKTDIVNPEDRPPEDLLDDETENVSAPESISGNVQLYTMRFTLLHLLSYLIAGSVFYQLSGYMGVVASRETLEIFRPREEYNYFFFLIISGQIFRGIVLALLIYPFHNTYIKKINGWFLLFGLLFGLTLLGSPVFIPVTLLREAAFVETIGSLRIGIPEAITQMLLFSVLFFYWQKRLFRKRNL